MLVAGSTFVDQSRLVVPPVAPCCFPSESICASI